ncbi:MAG: PLP-dependent transferase, partial [Methanomassiliicoccales archaeon]
MTEEKKHAFETICVHGGEFRDTLCGSVVTPIYQTSTFLYPYAIDGQGRYLDEKAPFFYTRLYNPTVQAVERKIASLEETDACVAFSSGMAAITTTVLEMLGSKGHVLAVRDL